MMFVQGLYEMGICYEPKQLDGNWAGKSKNRQRTRLISVRFRPLHGCYRMSVLRCQLPERMLHITAQLRKHPLVWAHTRQLLQAPVTRPQPIAKIQLQCRSPSHRYSPYPNRISEENGYIWCLTVQNSDIGLIPEICRCKEHLWAKLL